MDYTELHSLEYGLILCFDDGWWSFNDLDNLDYEHLIDTVTLKRCRVRESLWAVSKHKRTTSGQLTTEAHRQLEAMFNFVKLLEACSNCSAQCRTFRDLRLRGACDIVSSHQIDLLELAHDLEVWPDTLSAGESLSDCVQRDLWKCVANKLIWSFHEQGGTEIAMLMFKVPLFSQVRSLILQLFQAVLAVPQICLSFINAYPKFLRRITIICRDHASIEYRIIATSVLLNLVNAVIRFRLAPSCDMLIEMQLIDVLITSTIWSAPLDDVDIVIMLKHFLDLGRNAYQILQKIASNKDFCILCPDIVRIRLLNHCISQVIYAIDPIDRRELELLTVQSQDSQISPNLYMHAAECLKLTHNLGLILMIIYWLLRHSTTMHKHYREDDTFCCLLSDVYCKYSSPELRPMFEEVVSGVRLIVMELFPERIKHAEAIGENNFSLLTRFAIDYRASDEDCSESETAKTASTSDKSRTISPILSVRGRLTRNEKHLTNKYTKKNKHQESDTRGAFESLRDRPIDHLKIRKSLFERSKMHAIGRPKIRTCLVQSAKLKNSNEAETSALSTDAVVNFKLHDSSLRLKRRLSFSKNISGDLSSKSRLPCAQQRIYPEQTEIISARFNGYIPHVPGELISRLQPEFDEMMEKLDKLAIPSMYYQDSDGGWPVEPKGASDYYDQTTSSSAPTQFISCSSDSDELQGNDSTHECATKEMSEQSFSETSNLVETELIHGLTIFIFHEHLTNWVQKLKSRLGKVINKKLGMNISDWFAEISSVDSEDIPEREPFKVRLKKIMVQYENDPNEELMVPDENGQLCEIKALVMRLQSNKNFDSKAEAIEKVVTYIDKMFPKQSLTRKKRPHLSP